MRVESAVASRLPWAIDAVPASGESLMTSEARPLQAGLSSLALAEGRAVFISP